MESMVACGDTLGLGRKLSNVERRESMGVGVMMAWKGVVSELSTSWFCSMSHESSSVSMGVAAFGVVEKTDMGYPKNGLVDMLVNGVSSGCSTCANL
jgi:hypothetical protein